MGCLVGRVIERVEEGNVHLNMQFFSLSMLCYNVVVPTINFKAKLKRLVAVCLSQGENVSSDPESMLSFKRCEEPAYERNPLARGVSEH